ncbi:MAG: 50S ribosomal protein L19 [Candidatus Omnitrophica bacterium]|nr:50S ribosomal protein L19 [Candidatus Omnitrophota bacterium]
MDWRKRIHPTLRQIAKTAFGPGDDVRVWFRILEQGKERLGQFEGVVIRCAGRGSSKTFTVRRVTHGEGVERVFPMDAPVIERVEVLRRGSTRRSRLYFLRRVVKRTRLATAQESAVTVPSSGGPEHAETIPPQAAAAGGRSAQS